MNHELSLTLELLAEAPESLLFCLLLHNESAVKMLLPRPDILGLHFGNKTTMQQSEWFTNQFVSSSWGGLTLVPGEEKSIEYHVRPCSVAEPDEDDFSDYYRYCVHLQSGEYMVWFQFDVGKDYFCPDSHYQYGDLLREAEEQQAEVWLGEARSNRLALIRA